MKGGYIIVIFLILLLMQVPVPVAVGVATTYGLMSGGIGFNLIVSSPFHSLNSFILLAVPFFILAGNIMSRGTIAAKLLNVAKTFFGDRKEAIGISTLVACAFFAALSGSAVATLAALGAITIPMMQKEGYKTSYACAIAASGAIVGPIIPPSVIMCVYGVQTNTSITDLFIAGAIPGVLLTLSFIVAFTLTKKHNIVSREQPSKKVTKYTWKDRFHSIWDGKWALLMPIIVLGGIYSGIVTPTEAAIIACDYVILVSLFVTKDMKVKDLFEAFRLTVATMGGLMILLGMANVFGQVLTMNMIPQAVSAAVLKISNSPIFVLLAVNLILLIAGCFMEAGACIVIFTPILLPLVKACGITALQFGVIMCVNLVIGTLTPPFGLNLYVSSSISKEPVMSIVAKAIPFIISAIIILLLITFVPGIINFLPNLLKG